MFRQLVVAALVAGFAFSAAPAGAGDDKPASCEAAVKVLAETALKVGSPPRCVDEGPAGEGIAGWFDGAMTFVVRTPNQDHAYELEVAAHELGHAWSAFHLTPYEQVSFRLVFGEAAALADEEWVADVFAYSLGHYVDHVGDPNNSGWRSTSGPRPTQQQLNQLQEKGLLP